MSPLSLAAGVFLYLFVVLSGFTFNGGHLEMLLHPGEMIGVVFAPWVSLCTAYGMGGAFRQFGALFRAPTPESERFLSLWIQAAYGAGLLFLLLGLIVTMPFVAGNPVKIGEKIASAMAAPLLALFLVEGVLRPLRHRLARK